jgi:hypothetical protein
MPGCGSGTRSAARAAALPWHAVDRVIRAVAGMGCRQSGLGIGPTVRDVPSIAGTYCRAVRPDEAWPRGGTRCQRSGSDRRWASFEEEMMEFSERLDALQKRVAAAKADVQAAATESREQLGKRIDQAQGDLDRATQKAKQQADQAADRAGTKWAQMRADAAAKMENVKAKMDKRDRQMDAKLAASEAEWADADAVDAIYFAEWAVDNAELAILDAIDARAYAETLGKAAGS